jgi:hypothetical protein
VFKVLARAPALARAAQRENYVPLR